MGVTPAKMEVAKMSVLFEGVMEVNLVTTDQYRYIDTPPTRECYIY